MMSYSGLVGLVRKELKDRAVAATFSVGVEFTDSKNTYPSCKHEPSRKQSMEWKIYVASSSSGSNDGTMVEAETAEEVLLKFKGEMAKRFDPAPPKPVADADLVDVDRLSDEKCAEDL